MGKLPDAGLLATLKSRVSVIKRGTGISHYRPCDIHELTGRASIRRKTSTENDR